MAITVERMVAVLEARLDKYEKAIAGARRSTDQQFTAIERRGKQMESRLAAIGKNINAGISGFGRGLVTGAAGAFSTRAIVQYADSYTRIQNALKVTGLEGEALKRTYDDLFASAQRNLAPVESLVTLYGRLALAQDQLGVNSEQIINFTDRVALALRAGGTSAQEASGALLQLSQALGGGVVRAEEFNSILEGAPTIAQAAARGLVEAGGSVAKLRQLVVDGLVPSRAFFDAFIVGSQDLESRISSAEQTVSGALTRLYNSLTDQVGKMNETTHAGRAVIGMIDGIAAEIESFPAEFAKFSRFAEEIGSIGQAAENAIISLGKFLGTADLGPELLKRAPWLKDLGILTERGGTFQGAPRDIGTNQNLPPSSLPPVRLSDPRYRGAGGGGSGAGGSRSSGASEAERQADAIKRVTQELQFEYEQIGRNELAQRIANEQRAAGVSAASEEGQAIANLVARNYALEQSQEAATAAQERLNQAMQEVEFMASSALSSVITDLRNGESAAKSFERALDRIIDQLIDMASQQAMAALFSAAGSAAGGPTSIIPAAMAAFVQHKGGFAGTGPTRSVHPGIFAGAPRYHSGGIAGMRPGEVPAILQRGELIIPKNAVQGASRSGNVQVVINRLPADQTPMVRQEQNGDLQRVVIDLVKETVAKEVSDRYSPTGKQLAQRGVRPPVLKI